MRDVAGKVAFISGGASGIGFGMAQAFAQAGMKLALADIDKDTLESAVARLKAEGGTAIGVPLDVRTLESWENAARETEDRLGQVQIVCNNAGVACGVGKIEDVSVEDFDLTVSINLRGAFLGVKTFVPRLRKQGEGHVVNTASLAGLFTQPFIAPYTITKFGVVAMSESLRLELREAGIGVSVLCPAMVRTNIFKTSRKLMSSAAESDGLDAMAERISHGMDPLHVGARVLEAIRNNELYVVTHPEYRPWVAARSEQVVKACGASAQPGYVDDPTSSMRRYGAAAPDRI